MNWEEALLLIQNNIQLGLDVNTLASTFRFVTEVPPYQCKKYNYNHEVGYKVQIGEINAVEIPISMLKLLFHGAIENDGIYNTTVFRNAYPIQARNHGCHIHVVGKIFELSGVATNIGSNYHIR